MAFNMRSVLIIFVVVTAVAAKDQNLNQTETKKLGRSPRNYNSYFTNVDSGETSSESEEQPTYSDAGTIKPKSDYDYPDNGNYKGFVQFPGKSKGYFPATYNSYKGFPYSGPYVTGDELTDDQVMNMMTMMNAMNKFQGVTKKDEQGILSKLVSEPKVFLLAAVFPLAILLASFVPILMNYFMSGPAMPSTITTVASSKLSRALTDKEFLESTLQQLMEFGAKALSEDECFQKSLCELAISQGHEKNTKKIASIVSKYGKEEWLKSLHAKNLLKALEHGDCSKACQQPGKHHKHRHQK